MSSINICFFLGNLTRDPEVKFLAKGTAVADIGLAVNRVWKDDSGKKMEEVTFLNLTAFGRTAEICGDFLKKGQQAHFECHAKLDSWDDKETGKKRTAIKFIVDRLTMLSSGKRNDEGEEWEEKRTREREPSGRREPEKRPPPKDPDLDSEEDDFPI